MESVKSQTFEKWVRLLGGGDWIDAAIRRRKKGGGVLLGGGGTKGENNIRRGLKVPGKERANYPVC